MTGEVKTDANFLVGVPKEALDSLQDSPKLAEEVVSAVGVPFPEEATAEEVMRAALEAYPKNQCHPVYSAILQTQTQALAAERSTALLLNGNWLIGSILTVSEEGKPTLAFFPLHVQTAPGEDEPPVTWAAVIDAFLYHGANAEPCAPLLWPRRLASICRDKAAADPNRSFASWAAVAGAAAHLRHCAAALVHGAHAFVVGAYAAQWQ